MVVGCRATTELSSFTASSTTSLFGDFLRSRIAVLKSFFLEGSAATAWGSEGPASSAIVRCWGAGVEGRVCAAQITGRSRSLGVRGAFNKVRERQE